MTALGRGAVASRCALLEKATSMMRCTPPGESARMALTAFARSSATEFVTAGSTWSRSVWCTTVHRRAGPSRKLRPHRPDSAEYALDQDRLAFHRPVVEDGNDARGCPGYQDRLTPRPSPREEALFGRDDGELSRGPERPIGLRPVDPHALAHSVSIDAAAD